MDYGLDFLSWGLEWVERKGRGGGEGSSFLGLLVGVRLVVVGGPLR